MTQDINHCFPFLLYTLNIQLLNTSQDKAQCPPIDQAFSNVILNLEDFIPAGTSGLDLSIGQRRRRQADSSPNVVPSVGYIQECIVNQGFDFVRQYDIYRYFYVCSTQHNYV